MWKCIMALSAETDWNFITKSGLLTKGNREFYL